MKYILLVSLLMVSSCDVDNSDKCFTEHINTTTQIDRYGVTVEAADQMYATIPEITSYYEQTMACMGMTAVGPTIRYKSFSTEVGVGGAWAFYHPAGFVYVNTDPQPFADRDCTTDAAVLKHEFVHHILNFNDIDWRHGNVLFAQCGIGVNTNN